MATTAVIVEILVIGLIGSIWLVLFLSGISVLDPDSVYDCMVRLKDWSGLLTFLVIGLIYQFGWLINGFSYGILRFLLTKRMRDKIFEQRQLEHRNVRALVYQEASDKVRQDLDVERSVVRLSRAGMFNFLLISIALLINGSPFVKFAPFSLILSIGCGIQWYFRFARYYNRMIDDYDTIKDSNQ